MMRNDAFEKLVSIYKLIYGFIQPALPYSLISRQTQIFQRIQCRLLSLGARLDHLLLSYYFFDIMLPKQQGNQIVKNLFVIWTCSYAAEIIVPIACILIVRNSKYYRGGMALAGLVALYKLGVVITVMAVAWRHVGLCYIDYGMRVIIIVTNVLQIICLTVEILLLWRIKKVHRDVLLNNLIQKKTFAQN